ncbi:Probable lipoprotein precursor [Flavobacterium indicum GPTSA100-9 = DSM 17447]|uniref:Probable lipoprotein n=1 Tax=Flavobacterium indicum (strain DSM 17447 / CIP 109464 / GPTSA100-9) TaxID=1094466 RepID=H8XU41_FLAIG|nr:DUF4349 domain-containing protein [Flavobacterium indicum]CCG52824.1 Probable lipoprotein precursor [Flavobacterium indicum GPTSA100-9 = DSM 17447]
MKKTVIGLGTFALLILTLFACNKKAEETPGVSAMDLKTVATDSAAVEEKSMSSIAAEVDKNSKRQFIQTADLKFKVKSVTESTYKIESLTKKVGGFVTLSELRSTIINKDETKISQDSTLISTQFEVNNILLLRVPNIKLDTLLRSLTSEVQFLDYRVIKADDVQFQLLSKDLASKRGKKQAQRIENAIKTKGKKLKDITESEQQLGAKESSIDENYVEKLALEDQINFSTITIELYQNEQTKNEVIANSKNSTAFRPHIGIQILDSLQSGWILLENILSFLIQIWPLILFAAIVFYFRNKLKRKE